MAMKMTLKGSWTLLAIGFGICCIVFLSLPQSSIFHELAVNLGAGIAGSGLTFWLIDGVLQRQEEERTRRFAKVARARLKIPLTIHLESWARIYKACALSKPAAAPEKFSDLLRPENFQLLMWLDGNSPAPVIPSRNWFLYLFGELSEIKGHLEDVIDKFGQFLSAEELELITNCSDSIGLKTMLLMLRPEASAYRGQGPRSAFGVMNGEMQVVPIPGLIQYLENLDKLAKNIGISHGAISISDTTWSETVGPGWGSSRLPAQ